MWTADGNHGAYALRIAESLRQYAHDVLEENGRLRGVTAVLRTENERVAGQSEQLRRENEDLRDLLRLARAEAAAARDELVDVRRELASRERAHTQLEEVMRSASEEGKHLADQLASLGEQNNNLANLYVASYRLHGTLDHDEVIAALQEILANLVGSEETALFERAEDGPYLSLVASTGIQPDALRKVPLGRGLIGRVGETGQLYVAGQSESTGRVEEEQGLNACIPLSLAGLVVGVIAIFRLLPQKAGLQDLDHEIFDLLGSHAATALYCTALHVRALAGNDQAVLSLSCGCEEAGRTRRQTETRTETYAEGREDT